MRQRKVLLLIVLAAVAAASSIAGYLLGAGPWQRSEDEAAAPLLAGPPPLMTLGDRLISASGARQQLRGVPLATTAGPDEVRAALSAGVSAVGIIVEPDAFMNDPAEQERVAAAAGVAAEAMVYPVVAAAGPSGDAACGDGDGGAAFWAALAERLKGRPWVIYDLGAGGCAEDWTRQREYAAAAVDAVRQHAPDALVVVPAPEGTTGAMLAAAGVDRPGVAYRVLGAAPRPSAAVPLPAPSPVPLIMELPDLPRAGDPALVARVAVSDLAAAGAAGWFLPADADGPLGDAVALAFQGAARAERAGGEGLPQLRAAGNRLVDPDGNAVRLYGVNRPGMEVSIKLPDAPTQKDVERIAASGANLLRLPVNPQWYRTNPGYRRHALDAIAWAEARGLYTMLDLHWSTLQGEAICLPDMNLSTRFWQEAAFDLRGARSVIYDVYNEPCKTTWAVWRPLAERLVDAVRAVEPEALVAVSGPDWSYDFRPAGDDPVRRGNLIYSAHDYPWKAYLDREKAYGFLADRYPVMVTEFGADYQPRYGFYQDPLAFTRGLFDYAERRGLAGWAAWAWHPDISPKMFTGVGDTPTPYGGVVLERLAQRLHAPAPAPGLDGNDGVVVADAAKVEGGG